GKRFTNQVVKRDDGKTPSDGPTSQPAYHEHGAAPIAADAPETEDHVQQRDRGEDLTHRPAAQPEPEKRCCPPATTTASATSQPTNARWFCSSMSIMKHAPCGGGGIGRSISRSWSPFPLSNSLSSRRD